MADQSEHVVGDQICDLCVGAAREDVCDRSSALQAILCWLRTMLLDPSGLSGGG